MLKKYFYWLLIFFVQIEVLFAQDFTFSQFYEQPLLRNPALAGVFNGDLRVAMAYRDQWSSITVPYRTTSLSVEYKIPIGSAQDVLTIGSQMSMDGAGDIRLKRTQFLPIINFHKSLSGETNTYLSLAFMGGPVSSQFDVSQLKLGDQFVGGSYNASNSSMQPISNSGYSYWDMSTGLCFSTEFQNKARVYFAAGLAHFSSPVIKSVTTYNAGTLAPRLSLNIGSNAMVGEKGHIMAFVDFFSQNKQQQLLGGVMYGMEFSEHQDEEAAILYVGSFLRWGDALIPVIKLDFNHTSFGISYDVNVSKLNVASNWRGGIEITASYRGFLKIRNSTLDRIRCVRF
jgi:type IX secretion system PorP/SprF family membrane protein